MQNSFLTNEEISRIGFKSFGNEISISRYARFYQSELMEIGDHVRIDDFCILSGNIKIGNHVHISSHTVMLGKFGITMEDYTGLSPRCTVLSASDDFSGDYLIGPMVDAKYTNVTGGPVLIKKYSQVGAGSIIFPNLTVGEGAAVGAMSLVTASLDEWSIYKGIPARFSSPRSKKLLNMVK